MLVEQVRLDDERGTRLAVVAGKRDRDEVAALRAQPSSSATASSQCKVAASSGSPRSAADCRRHSSAKPGRRTSGTQIWTGRNPAARNAARCFWTRSATRDRSVMIPCLTRTQDRPGLLHATKYPRLRYMQRDHCLGKSSVGTRAARATGKNLAGGKLPEIADFTGRLPSPKTTMPATRIAGTAPSQGSTGSRSGSLATAPEA